MSHGHALVTGANGFVGQTLCNTLKATGWNVRGVVRKNAGAGDFLIPNIGPNSNWATAMEGVKCVVHLAARTHVLNDSSSDPMQAYRDINVAGTVSLTRAAAKHGVERFVFLSSIKVNGEHTVNQAFTEHDAPRPEDAYGVSKYEAEQALWQIAKETGLAVTVIRPPLVYGPGVKANFLRLMHLVARRRPLPLASIKNQRSLIYLGNLVDAIVTCMEHPAAAGKTYLVSDSETVSTPELIRHMGTALGRKPCLLPAPLSLLGAGASLFGRSAEWGRLSSSLKIDSSKICNDLNWLPPFTLAQGLSLTAQWYHSHFAEKSTT